jgi:NAD(P)-dependent dehydrogenase (short-subunit alcohol dehydrogenase family)
MSSKNIIVTGASRGIGREILVELASRGHHTMGVARSGKELEALQGLHPEHIRSLTTDLTDSSDISDLVHSVSESASGVDILINNAGALINKPFTELTGNDWKHMLDVNLLSVINLTKALLPLMNKNSHIVNISSMGGFQGSSKFPGLTAYSVAKGAVSILSECLAVEFSDLQIRVNALCLGSVQTEMFNQAFPDFDAATQPEAMGTYVADFALNGSDFYNGKVLPVALNNPS